MATTLRVSESTRARVAQLAAQAGTSMGEVVDRALDAYSTSRFWEQTRAGLTSRAADPDDAAWDRSLRDGLNAE